jgi:hypothetical protein
VAEVLARAGGRPADEEREREGPGDRGEADDQHGRPGET